MHRLWGRLIGFVYALPLIYFLVRRQVPRRLVLPLAGIFLLGFAQGALGWYMVKSGLADRVSVSQYRLVAHLALALAIYARPVDRAAGIASRMRERGLAVPAAGEARRARSAPPRPSPAGRGSFRACGAAPPRR